MHDCTQELLRLAQCISPLSVCRRLVDLAADLAERPQDVTHGDIDVVLSMVSIVPPAR